MERRMLLAAILIILQLLLVALITPSSCYEREDHRCGHLDGDWAYCDLARCCSYHGYCGDTDEYCNYNYCWYQCHDVPVPDQSNHEEAETGGGGGVVVTRLVNATHNSPYLNLNIGRDDQLVNVQAAVKVQAADNASSSSSSSSLSSSLSCARSLSRLPLASRYKYPFAALRALQAQSNTTTATRCGRCLKVTNLRVGGLHSQVKVRIVDEPSNVGLELDLNTFKQLDTDGRGITEGRLLVKYQFESC